MVRSFNVARTRARQVEDSPSLFVQVLVEQLQAQGYAPASVRSAARLVKDFANWLDEQAVGRSDLLPTHAVDYLNYRWLHQRRRRGDAHTLRAFVRLLAAEGCAAQPAQPDSTTPARGVRNEFEGYLLHQRGLAAATIRLYGEAVGRFLEYVFGQGEVRLGGLTAADVTSFVQTDAARLHHAKRAKVMTSALRSFLRYGRYRGDISADLPACVPTVANWSMAGIPRTISTVEVQKLLAHCDRRSAAGCRDYAMLLLLARQGSLSPAIPCHSS